MHDDEISELLIQSMAFLEFMAEHDGIRSEESHANDINMLWAVHSHIQRAWSLIKDHDDPTELSMVAREMVDLWRDESRQINAQYNIKN